MTEELLRDVPWGAAEHNRWVDDLIADIELPALRDFISRLYEPELSRSDWTASADGEVIPVMAGGHIVRTWVETTRTGNRTRYSIDAETAKIGAGP
jgi:hypothetical protein